MEIFSYPLPSVTDRRLLHQPTLFIDIETDGLSHKNKLVIIGLVLITKETKQLIQLFNDDYGSEREMLLELRKIITAYDIDFFISFNGNAFDLPFINARYAHYKIDYSLPKLANFDLLKYARSHQGLLSLSDLKLKTIERHVGIHRDDLISGKDSIILYHAYIETRDLALKKSILLHNYDDLLNMIPLFNITHPDENPFPFLMSLRGAKWYASVPKIKENTITITFHLDKRICLTELIFERHDIAFHYEETEATLRLKTVPLTGSNGHKLDFINPKLIYDQSLTELSHDLVTACLVLYEKQPIYGTLEKIYEKTIEIILAQLLPD